jgi:hypothetical protein
MDQDQQPRPWRWAWTGLETKSAGDWLELLIIPIVLGAGIFWFNRRERRALNVMETRGQESEQALAREERKTTAKLLKIEYKKRLYNAISTERRTCYWTKEEIREGCRDTECSPSTNARSTEKP